MDPKDVATFAWEWHFSNKTKAHVSQGALHAAQVTWLGGLSKERIVWIDMGMGLLDQ